tara:strand:+ start:492 stop:851 length:360 start_codon:yes stop_codon:yes gene_type:complete
MDAENFIYHKIGGKVMSAGYSINSKLLEGGIPALANYKIQTGGSIESLAVPAGLFLLQQSITTKTNALEKIGKEPEVIGEGLYDKLLELMEPRGAKKKNPKRKTRRKKKKKTKRKTRRL